MARKRRFAALGRSASLDQPRERRAPECVVLSEQGCGGQHIGELADVARPCVALEDRPAVRMDGGPEALALQQVEG